MECRRAVQALAVCLFLGWQDHVLGQVFISGTLPLPRLEQADQMPAFPANFSSQAWQEVREKSESLQKRRIILDAGHGGKDVGASGRPDILEKQVNLELVQTLARRLESDGRFLVVVTREGDSTVSLFERTKKGFEEPTILFISLHANWLKDGRIRGTEIYVPWEKTDPSKNLDPCENKQTKELLPAVLSKDRRIWALQMDRFALQLSALIRTHFPDRTVRVQREDFFVLRCAGAPSVLIEVGYVSNSGDAKRIEDAEWRGQMAEAIYQSIVAYFYPPPYIYKE